MTSRNALSNLYQRMILIGFFLTIGSLYFRSASVTLGVLAGFLLAVVNLWLIQRTVGGLLAGERTSMAGIYVVKIAAILLVLFLLIGVVGLDPMGIMAGFSVLVVVSTVGSSTILNENSDQSGAMDTDVESRDG